MSCCGKADAWKITITKVDGNTTTVLSHGKTVWKAMSLVYKSIDVTNHKSWLCENMRSGVAAEFTIEKIGELLS